MKPSKLLFRVRHILRQKLLIYWIGLDWLRLVESILGSANSPRIGGDAMSPVSVLSWRKVCTPSYQIVGTRWQGKICAKRDCFLILDKSVVWSYSGRSGLSVSTAKSRVHRERRWLFPAEITSHQAPPRNYTSISTSVRKHVPRHFQHNLITALIT